VAHFPSCSPVVVVVVVAHVFEQRLTRLDLSIYLSIYRMC
jgi:hypothetical protein